MGTNKKKRKKKRNEGFIGKINGAPGMWWMSLWCMRCLQWTCTHVVTAALIRPITGAPTCIHHAELRDRLHKQTRNISDSCIPTHLCFQAVDWQSEGVPRPQNPVHASCWWSASISVHGTCLHHFFFQAVQIDTTDVQERLLVGTPFPSHTMGRREERRTLSLN